MGEQYVQRIAITDHLLTLPDYKGTLFADQTKDTPYQSRGLDVASTSNGETFMAIHYKIICLFMGFTAGFSQELIPLCMVPVPNQ